MPRFYLGDIMEYNIYYIMPENQKVYELTSYSLLNFELNVQEYLDSKNTVEFDLETFEFDLETFEFDLETFVDLDFLENTLGEFGFKKDITNPDSKNIVYFKLVG